MQAETPHRSLKERQRQERAALILQVAEEVLTEKGYHETSMDEIAARVGVAKGTVYLHFPSKEDLVFALFQRELEAFLEVVEQISALPTTARARLENILYRLYQGLLGKRVQLLVSLSTSMDVHKGLLAKKERLHDHMGRLSAYVTTLLDEGKAAGEFDASIPTTVMLSTFFSLLSPQAYKRLIVEQQMSPEELMSHLGRIYFKGIAAL
jgi:AcrR family transcriptional regulator